MKFTSLYLSSIKSSVEYEETISTLMNIISSDRKVKIFVPIVKNMEIFQNAICDKQCAISYGILEDEAIELISCEKYSFVIEKIIKQFNALKDDCEFILCLGQKSCELNALVNKDIHLEITKHLQAIHVDIINCKDLSKIRIEQILNAKEIIYKQCGCLNIATLLLNANDAPNYRNIFCNKFDTNILSLIEENSTKELSITPIAFEFKLMQRARSQKKKIVLPESGDDRVLKAASILLEREVCDILLLGDNDYINQKEKELKLNLKKATILNPKTSPLHVEFTNAFYEMRKSKGMNLEKASELMNDLNYFGTMLIHTGLADGMVSGAIHTTADTIRPALQIIKTKPNISIISSVFFMCLDKQVLVFGDCAINPKPSAAELAQIAISSAQTSKAFGIEPKIAMLSYSTGASGSGEDVEKVITATELVKEQSQGLLVEGPIQYDAAVDMDVAKTKLPNSLVAGNANVFIFPDLNSGNIGYKAVQRSSGALAIGPVLQGLNKPVNDLSRGCLVEDIINTVAITAIQAQGE